MDKKIKIQKAITDVYRLEYRLTSLEKKVSEFESEFCVRIQSLEITHQAFWKFVGSLTPTQTTLLRSIINS